MTLQELQTKLAAMQVTPPDIYRAAIYLQYIQGTYDYLNYTLTLPAANNNTGGLGDNYNFFRQALQDPELMNDFCEILDDFIVSAVNMDLTNALSAYEAYFTNTIFSETGDYNTNVVAFYNRYPTTLRAMQRLTANFKANILQACQRIFTDRVNIRNVFADNNTSLTGVKKIKSTGSDFHKGGKQVLIITFNKQTPINGTVSNGIMKIVYKPSDVEADFLIAGDSTAVNIIHPDFQQQSLFELLNTFIPQPPDPEAYLLKLPTYKILPFQYGSRLPTANGRIQLQTSYGYIEFLEYIERKPESNIYNDYPLGISDNVIIEDYDKENIVNDFYTIMGQLLAVACTFSIIDMHIENVIVSKYKPYLIDLEVSLFKSIDTIDNTSLFGKYGGIEAERLEGVETTYKVHYNAPAFIEIAAAPSPVKQNRIWKKPAAVAVPYQHQALPRAFNHMLQLIGRVQQNGNNPLLAWYNRLLPDTVAGGTGNNGVIVRYIPFPTKDFKQILTYIYLAANVDNSRRDSMDEGGKQYNIYNTALPNPIPNNYVYPVPNFLAFSRDNTVTDFQNCDTPVFYHRLGTTDIYDSIGAIVVIPDNITYTNNAGQPVTIPINIGRTTFFNEPQTQQNVWRQIQILGNAATRQARIDTLMGQLNTALGFNNAPGNILVPQVQANKTLPSVNAPSINAIITVIQSLQPETDGSLILHPGKFNMPVMSDFFTKALLEQQLNIANPGINIAANGLSATITGQATVMGHENMEITLSFAQDPANSAQVVLGINARYPSTGQPRVPVLTWIQLDGAGFTSVLKSEYSIVLFAYYGNILLGGANNTVIPIGMQQTNTDEWTVTAAQNTHVPLTAIGQLLTLINMPNLDSFFPQPLLTVLSNLAVTDVVFTFNTQEKTVRFISAVLEVTNGWNITSGISVSGIALMLTIVDPAHPDNRQVIGKLTGTITVGNIPVPVFIQAAIGSNNNSWMVGLQPGASVTLPTLTELLTMTGEADMANMLPDSLKALPAITIQQLEVDFDPVAGALNQFDFAITTAAPWQVLPGYFEVNNISIALSIRNVTVPAKRTIQGNIASTFSIGNIMLQCMVNKSADDNNWNIAGGLYPGQTVTMAAVATTLFGSQIVVPDILNSIAFSNLSVTVIPAAGSFTFTAGSDNTCWIIDGTLGITGLQLSFSRSPQGIITGTFTGSLEIEGVDVTLTAKLAADAGWQFTGSAGENNPIPVGALITFIGKKFGAKLPKFVDNITLQHLDIAYNTGNGNFQFAVSGTIPMAGNPIAIQVSMALARNDKGYAISLTGNLTIGNAKFTIDFENSTTGTQFAASWQDAAGIDLNTLVTGLGLSLPPIPPDLDLTLNSAALNYNTTPTTSSLCITAGSVKFGQAVLAVATPVNSKPAYYFGLAINETISLSNLPLIGRELAGIQSASVTNLQVNIVSATTDQQGAAVFNGMIPAGYPQVPVAGLTSPLVLSMQLNTGNNTTPLNVAVGGSQSNNNTPALITDTNSTVSQDSTKWLIVQQTFGPVTIQKIGVKYDSGVLWFLLNASLSAGGLNITLEGAAIGSPISSFHPQFNLQGMSISYQEPPLAIGGGFLNVPVTAPVTFEYAGDAFIKTPEFSIAALGSYASINGSPSMFVFASVTGALGGPPCLFVTGLMAGFGYNRSLRLPAQNEVFQFPLIAGLTNPAAVGGNGAKPTDVIAILEGQNGQPAWITPQIGQNWLAAGIMFSSFELVNATVMLAAEFGQELAFALIGLATARFPQTGPECYAYLGLGIEAVYQPARGFLGISAMLSPNSFVIDAACKLTGGFAFYTWMSGNAHEGDFVITAGGYHPHFTVPAWYPEEPRVGFNWAVDASVSISGSAYFALTPSAIMTGGELNILFQSGNLKAWFRAYADMLIYWKPFRFQADIGVVIGVSYKLNLLFTTKTITAELGASMQLWGPPTGGTVRVHWFVISFTVNFGAGTHQQQSTLTWNDFQQLLPSAEDVIKIVPVNGITSTTGSNSAASNTLQNDENNGKVWVVRPGNFSFSTSAAVPSSGLYLGSSSTRPFQTGNVINIRPMQATNLAATHRVFIKSADGTEKDLLNTGWKVTGNYRNGPQALWGTGDGTQVPSGADQLVPRQLSGVSITAPDPQYGTTPGAIDTSLLNADPLTPGVSPLASVSPSGAVPYNGMNTIEIIEQGIMAADGVINRNALFQSLQQMGIDPGTNDTLTNFAAACNNIFTQDPMITNTKTTKETL